jgi:hypothetical protein
VLRASLAQLGVVALMALFSARQIRAAAVGAQE